jgi:1-acyl-sn-glycerol-3-phosphate acyltransferase
VADTSRFGIVRRLVFHLLYETMLLENWPKPARNLLFTVLGLKWALEFLADLIKDKPSKFELLTRVFERNNFDVQVKGEDKIPNGRGCIFATNHPHGFFDGLGAMWLASKHGHDCRAIGRHFISIFEPIQDWFLFIKLDENRRSETGQQVTEQSAEFLKNGGSLGISSAGRLSISRPLWRPAKDLPWKTGTVRIAQAAEAPIVLLYVDVNHSVIRQMAQGIHGVVRAIIQVWAYRFGRSQKLHMHVLDVVYPQEIPKGTVKEQTQWLQAHFDKLAAAVEKK